MTAAIDAMVAQFELGLAPPPSRREAVLVAGPWLAGTSSVAAVLRDRLPECAVLEADQLGAGEVPAAVVFVVSATAPLAGSDCALLTSVAADTDAVIGVVAKIDVHRTWREVLDANRALLADVAPRYRDVPWVGVAAAPDLGPPILDDLVATLRSVLADDTLVQRNRLREWEVRLLSADDRLNGEVDDRQARVSALRAHRAAAVRRTQWDKTERTIALRTRIQQARLQSSSCVRHRCASVRAELRDDVAGASRRALGDLDAQVRCRAEDVADDVADEVTAVLTDVGAELGLPVDPDSSRPVVRVGPAPLRSRGPETLLMLLLGAGFGLGVALTVSRVFADLAPRWAVGGAVGGAILGVVLTAWMAGLRAVLHDRAVLDRWVVEVVASVRAALDEWVAVRMLAAEAELGRAAAERDAAAAAQADETLAGIDRDIRTEVAAAGRATRARDLRAPAIARALAAVRDEREALNRGKGSNYALLNRSCE
ncbi:hypothetical protein [Mycobacterium sp. shizuoka-1]|uniref:hypothetical protein n=1 Tax=Mycobacterium sp. shizuoka-1 TaxID=2039281 RepID=UPI000C061D99|nr:hypothetical protein [Mycobacterium sp. shizuoka-1]GAY18781.1 hypothetical protein MSZK_55070 [Mycobacterium sp. shizuoka-1]